MAQQTSTQGLEFISKEEGEVLHIYNDQVGVKTIGIGHALRPGESFPNGITHDEAIALLKKDASYAEDAINKHCTAMLSQNAFDACVSFTFNLGTGAFISSTLLKLLNQGDFAGAAAEFPKWCHAPAGVVNPGILARRKREAALFLTPDPSGSPDGTPAVPNDPAAGNTDPFGRW
jgi:lysozyme